MDYSELPTILKRFSFDEKMKIAYTHSQQTFTYSGIVDFNTLRRIPTPWEIETFVLFSIKAEEWKNDSFTGKNLRKFYQIIDCIRNKNPEALDIPNNPQIFEWILPLLGSVQFEAQEFFPYKMFRFNYYFSYRNDEIDMPAHFKEKFGCDFYTYALLGFALRCLFSNKVFPLEAFHKLIYYFSVPVKNLTVTRNEYIRLLDSYAQNTDDYLFCLRPSYSFPFISEKGIVYCPLPHLISRATTASLMYRLTEGNDSIKRDIGKEVYESYLYTIINDSKLFDEVLSEQKYTFQRTESRTTDIMARKNNTYVFMDCKSFSPKIAIRNLNQKALDQDVKRLAEACAQVYKHIRHRFSIECHFFAEPPADHEFCIFGLVVIQEDAYLKSDLVYRKTAEILRINEDNAEYNWLCKHVGVVPIHRIERFCFSRTDICSSLVKTSSTVEIPHNWLCDDSHSAYSYREYSSFIDTLAKDTARLLTGIGVDIQAFK